MISDYFSKIKEKLDSLNWIIIKQIINFDLVSQDFGIIDGILIFLDNSTLEFIELVDDEANYRFQYMDKNKNLIYRWDTAPHHKEISTFPYHLHTSKGVERSRRMNLIEVLDVIIEKVIEKLEGL